jgi:hypothetical protein
MPAYMSDVEVNTHQHYCLSCRTHFSCPVSFCDTLDVTICDRCNFHGLQESEPPPSYEALEKYMRERSQS